jgi:hypothetical protein
MVRAAFPAGTRAMARPKVARLNCAGRFPESGVQGIVCPDKTPARQHFGVTVDRSTNVEALVGYLALPEAIAEWSRTNLRERLVKIGARSCVAVPKELVRANPAADRRTATSTGFQRAGGADASSPRGVCLNGERAKWMDPASFWTSDTAERWESCVGRPWLPRNPAEC